MTRACTTLRYCECSKSKKRSSWMSDNSASCSDFLSSATPFPVKLAGDEGDGDDACGVPRDGVGVAFAVAAETTMEASNGSRAAPLDAPDGSGDEEDCE